MIPNGENLHYLAIKILSAMLRVITSKHDGDFYSLKLELITEKWYVKIKIFVMLPCLLKTLRY